MWYAGIDWADEKHDLLVLDEVGHQVGKRQVKHSVEGLKELTDFLQSISGKTRKAEMFGKRGAVKTEGNIGVERRSC
jgi:hypothetical protein